jgi:hypothetical protein
MWMVLALFVTCADWRAAVCLLLLLAGGFEGQVEESDEGQGRGMSNVDE